MIAAQHRAESPSLHVASAKICASAAETSDSAGPDSEVHTACAMPELSQPVQRAAQSGPADIQSADFSWAPGRHGMVRCWWTTAQSTCRPPLPEPLEVTLCVLVIAGPGSCRIIC